MKMKDHCVCATSTESYYGYLNYATIVNCLFIIKSNVRMRMDFLGFYYVYLRELCKIHLDLSFSRELINE